MAWRKGLAVNRVPVWQLWTVLVKMLVSKFNFSGSRIFCGGQWCSALHLTIQSFSPACWAVISFLSFYFMYCKSSFKPCLCEAPPPPFQEKKVNKPPSPPPYYFSLINKIIACINNCKTSFALIRDGLLTCWKFGFVFDPQLHELQLLVVELFHLAFQVFKENPYHHLR